MEEYIELLVLTYFRDHTEEYSLSELREMIGVSLKQLDEIIDRMICEKKLIYEDSMLRISFDGRIMLMDSSMEDYHIVNEEEINSRLLKANWPIDKPYFVSKFSKKKWRNA